MQQIASINSDEPLAFEDHTMLTVARLALVAFFLVAGLPGCAKHSDLSKEVSEALSKPLSKEFLLGPEDVLEVTVWRNQELSRQVVIRPDGLISLPLIGDVKASGLTTNQLAERIAKLLKEFKENPAVSVTVKEINSYFVYVLGEVGKPAKYQLKSYTTVLQAIAMAGGFTVFASKNKIQVVRNMSNGDLQPHEVRIPINYKELISGSSEVGNIFLKSGDIVVVP